MKAVVFRVVVLWMLATTISAIEALDAIARAHGALYWQVTYCLPARQPEIAFLELRTHDDRGISTRVLQRQDADGKLIDPCKRRK
jgi:hypothetical protein